MKTIYQELGKKVIQVDEPPPLEVVNFCSKIWKNHNSHNKNAEWIKKHKVLHKNQQSQPWKAIYTEDTTYAINKRSNWKSTRIDKVTNFWLKHLISIHEDMAKAYIYNNENPTDVPDWIEEGLTYLLLKTEETKNPKNYRPITCLLMMYKILTSIITERTYMFLSECNLLPSEQKGCKRGTAGGLEWSLYPQQ